MSFESVPSGETGLTYERRRFTAIGGNVTVTDTWTGPTASVQAKETALIAEANALSGLASMDVREDDRGRATLTAIYESTPPGNGLPGIDQATQTFKAIRFTRDVYTADYFKTLTNAEVIEVRKVFEYGVGAAPGNWTLADFISSFSDLQKKLYGHLTHGQESVMDLAYEFKTTTKTTSARNLRKAFDGQNTVFTSAQIYALMNSTTKKLVENVPSSLEWLKDPVELDYLGRGQWAITETYIGLKQWSCIYGANGTFTGLDPA